MIKQTADVWWKGAVVYCADVETFFDGDGDGVGDLAGLVDRVDYLAGMGVDCLWLMPFQPTPNRDDGYDTTDHYGVDPRLGSPGDVVELLRVCRDRGIRVIMDLVVNHTSDQHPWFQRSRRDPASPYRDYYVWRDEPPEGWQDELVFPDEEDSNWAWDEEAGAHYLHMFYAHQPDLNVANPAVRDEIAKIAGYWLELGMSGFRVDAVPFLLEISGVAEEVDIDPHQELADLRRFLGRRRGDAVLLGEVNLPPEQQRAFFGDEDGDQLHMVFAFPVNQALYLALARGSAAPLAAALRSLPPIPEDCQWAHFVRNHDELSLDQLSDEERAEVFAAFGPEEHMQLYGRGIRRRLPSMLDGDRARMELVYSLLFALPGTPVLFYGEEIGMAEDLRVEGRLAVRTPMQWSSEQNGGFSPGGSGDLVRPMPEGRFGPEQVNVADQRADPSSFLNWVERLIRRRRECPEIGWGRWCVLDDVDERVLALRYDWHGTTTVVLHNLSHEDVELDLALEGADGWAGVDDLLDRRRSDHGLRDGRLSVELPGHGYRWLRARTPDDRLPT